MPSNKNEWVKPKGITGLQLLDVTPDLRCCVGWHLLKHDFHHRPKARKSNQKLKPSQNQYRYDGHVRGDDKNRHFYSDNVELVKRLVLNHARRIMKERITLYTLALQGLQI